MIHQSEIVQQDSDASKNIAIDTQFSSQGNGLDTEHYSAVLEEVEKEIYIHGLSDSAGMMLFDDVLGIACKIVEIPVAGVYQLKLHRGYIVRRVINPLLFLTIPSLNLKNFQALFSAIPPIYSFFM